MWFPGATELGDGGRGVAQILPQDDRLRLDDQDRASPSPCATLLAHCAPTQTSDGMPDSARAAVEHTRQELAPHRRPPGDIELFLEEIRRSWLVGERRWIGLRMRASTNT